MSELLHLVGVTAGYAQSVVVEHATMHVDDGECVALLGRNGMGKSTLLLTIMGLTRRHGGGIFWRGTDVAGWPAHARAAAGLGWVPQERRTWRSLTVDEHLDAVARPGTWSPAKVRDLFPRLAERGAHRGSQLSGGEQQMLAIARALVTNPRLLLLDEPMEGLAPIVVQELAQVLRALVASGELAVLLVEQRAELALSLASRAIVMERGRIAHEGPAAELRAKPQILEGLLGVAAAAR
ncbi:MAG TPA: ABC transporter ATP-binding protein [Usitatibacter sp.]|nr:ABC transporter ATP-binding protein [Usitatibacter sp.]